MIWSLRTGSIRFRGGGREIKEKIGEQPSKWLSSLISPKVRCRKSIEETEDHSRYLNCVLKAKAVALTKSIIRVINFALGFVR